MAKFVAKKHLVRSPTLLIGVGGIGGQIIEKVNNALSEHDKSCLRMVVMDTNSGDLEKFENTGIPYIQTSENQTVQEYLAAFEEFLKWFPTDPLINAKSLILGAGQIRSVSRLGALASKGQGKFQKIDDAVDEILTNQGDSLTRAVRVMIVGSVTGGTGSGLSIQLPFYIRKVLDDANIPNVLIRGLFLMPSLTESAQDTDEKERAVNVNGYAFLKELNAFYRLQKTKREDNKLRIEEYVPGMTNIEGGTSATEAVAMIPYEFLYLVEKQNKEGIIGGLDDYIERSAQIVTNQLFSPISTKGFSAEDNLITSAVPKGGMNRYCGAGVSSAIYPKDEVIRYCTVRYANQIIGEYWLKIDDTFRIRDEQQRRLRKTNPGLMPLDKATAYCSIFDDMCNPKKHDVSSEVSELKGELYVTVTDADGKSSRLPLVDTLLKHIKTHLEDVFAESGLGVTAEGCKMTAKSTNKPEDVATDITNKMEALRSFKETADSTVSALVTATAEEIMPSDLATAKEFSRDALYNIYVALKSKHPIIARYVLYSLLTKLKAEKEDADSRLNADLDWVSIFNKDYFDEGDKDNRKETPTEALSKTKTGWLSAFNLYSSQYKTLVETIIDDVSAEAAHTLDMANHSLLSVTYRIVIERIEAMIELYESFFKELGNIMEDKKKEAENLESGRGTGVNEVFVGDKYICCNATCKKALYDEFLYTVTDAELQMTDKVKIDFFDKMFGEYAVSLIVKDNPTALVSHISYRDLFEQGILVPVTAQFASNGFKHLDMGILDAIYKQFQIETKNATAKKDSDEFKEYFRSVCTTLCSLAEPYLLYNKDVAGYKSGGSITYAWGLNHSCVADFQTGDPEATSIDAAALHKMFSSGHQAPLVDDSFTPYSMVCYATIYDLLIENCISYKVGSRAQSCYAERLSNLVNREFVLSKNQDSVLDVIHPHLDRRWHEHAYLPELMGYDEDKMSNNIRLAFILALALNRCKYVDDKIECIKGWCYKDSGEKTGKERLIALYMNDEVVKSESVFALYKAFDCNRAMVEDVLSLAETKKKEAYDSAAFGGITEEAVLAQPIINGMLGGDGKLSVLDIVYELYKSSGNRKITSDIITTLEKYLKEYCLTMLNNNENKAAALCKKIKYAIGEACIALKAEDTSIFFKEDISDFAASEEE